MGPNARSVLQAMKRMDGLGSPITTIAVGHGPVLHHHLDLWTADYRHWSSERSQGEAASVVQVSAQIHGEVRQLNQQLDRFRT